VGTALSADWMRPFALEYCYAREAKVSTRAERGVYAASTHDVLGLSAFLSHAGSVAKRSKRA
jgi:hypothetical protein